MNLQDIPTAELRSELQRRRASAPPCPITLLAARLVRKAAACYGISPTLVIGRSQLPIAARCRWAVWEALRVAGHDSPTEVATVFGRDHGTLINAWKKAAALKHYDPKFAACLDLLLA